MSLSATSIESTVADHRRLFIATGATLFIGWLGDFLFWHVAPGVSIGIFFAMVGTLLFATGERSRSATKALVLLAACTVQSGVELCFTNIACLLLLAIALFGETTFGSITGLWARWSEALVKILSGPFRWGSLLRSWAKTDLANSSRDHLRGPTLGRLFITAFPALIVAIVFSLFLASGNAVLAEVFSRIGAHIRAWLTDISIARTSFWLVWMTLGVALFWPGAVPEDRRWWTRAIPMWNRGDASIARWQSALLLAAVNGLFFAANTIDVVYLWAAKSLPEGVNHSQFVHEGVHSLIGAVVLAAIILAIIFQQQPSVARTNWLRWLALTWIAQNVVLIFGVLRRLQLYVEAFQLSELRVYVACFLALVTVGFLLLSRHVWAGMKLGRLIFENAIATFLLLFALQFCDVGTWVANWNVRHWEEHRDVTIDLAYLTSLGSRGWPALSAIAKSKRDANDAEQAASLLRGIAPQLRADLHARDWRSYQARWQARAQAVVSEWGAQ